MRLHELQPTKGTTKKRKRVGRGTASGTGTTSGRGNNGQGQRSGGGKRPGFEGGQMPLFRRLPKRGFNNDMFATNYATLNVSDLERYDANTEITAEFLLANGHIKKLHSGLKILGDGELSKPLVIKAHKFTKSAVKKIEAAGGKAEVI